MNAETLMVSVNVLVPASRAEEVAAILTRQMVGYALDGHYASVSMSPAGDDRDG